MSARTGYGAPAVTRAIAILGALAVHGPSNATELSRLVGISKSSIGDICSALTAAQLVSRRRDGEYVLGLQMERLAGRMGGDPRLYELFDTSLTAESSLDGLTVTLDVLYGGELVCLAARLGRLPLPATPRPGMRDSFFTSAAGTAVGQDAPPDVLKSHFTVFSPDHGAEFSGRQKSSSATDGTLLPAPVAMRAVNGQWHAAAAVPWHREAPVLAAVVVHLPESTSPEAVRTMGDAAVRCARSISESLQRRARISRGGLSRPDPSTPVAP